MYNQLQNPEDIRSEPTTYQDVLVRQINRICQQVPNAVNTYDRRSLMSLESSIIVMDSLIHARANQNYLEISKKIKMSLDKSILDQKQKRFKYFQALMLWFRWEVKQLTRFGLLPDISESLHMGASKIEKGV